MAIINTFRIIELPRIVDGDTLHCVVDLGFFVQIDVDVRLNGVDAPELHGPTHKQGAIVKNAFMAWMLKYYPAGMVLESTILDKYRRSLGNIRATTGESVTTWLLQNKLVRVYDGATKPPWTKQELADIDAYVSVL